MSHAFVKPTMEADLLGSISVLSKGVHETAADGMCAMEAVSLLAGEPWTDEPDCACPVIGAFLRSWNDDLSESRRTELLRPLLTKIVGTRRPEMELIRSIMAADWLVRECVPAWIGLAGAAHAAQGLEALPKFVAAADLAASEPTLMAAQQQVRRLREARWVTWRPGEDPGASEGNESRAKSVDYAMHAARLEAERLARASGAGAAGAAAIVGEGMMALSGLVAGARSLVSHAAHIVAGFADQDGSRRLREKLQRSSVALINRMIEASR